MQRIGDVVTQLIGAPQATSCCLIHSRRAWSIRVCQPRPPARKWSMTSWDNRMVVDTFGRAFGGTPPACSGLGELLRPSALREIGSGVGVKTSGRRAVVLVYGPSSC